MTPDVRPEDALQVAQRALQKANELEQDVADLEAENERLRERLVALEASKPDQTDYQNLDRHTKVGMVREHVVQRAQQQHGKAAVDYDDVMWEVFDGEPSADHCYTLMERAATAEGFQIRDPKGENRQLTVDIDATNPMLGFSHANKDSAEGVR